MGKFLDIYKEEYENNPKNYLNNTELYNMIRDVIQRITVSKYPKIDTLKDEVRAIYLIQEAKGGISYAQYLGLSRFLDTCVRAKVENEDLEKRDKDYCLESIRHFINKKVGLIRDDGRYFYHKEHLDDFIEKYKEASKDINLEKIHIGIVYDDINKNKFYAYEVVHKCIWDKYKNNKDICQARE